MKFMDGDGWGIWIWHKSFKPKMKSHWKDGDQFSICLNVSLAHPLSKTNGSIARVNFVAIFKDLALL